MPETLLVYLDGLKTEAPPGMYAGVEPYGSHQGNRYDPLLYTVISPYMDAHEHAQPTFDLLVTQYPCTHSAIQSN